MSRTGGRGQEGRRWIGIDLDPRNEALVRKWVAKVKYYERKLVAVEAIAAGGAL